MKREEKKGGNIYLPFLFCLIQYPGERKRSLPYLTGILLVLVHCALVDKPELIEQVTHQCALTRVHVT